MAKKRSTRAGRATGTKTAARAQKRAPRQQPQAATASAEELKELKKRVRTIIRRLKKAYPDARPELRFSNPLELLVATVLSAQCTDERVNRVTESLFKKYRSAEDYAKADRKQLEEEIKPTGFYRRKAELIQQMARALVEQFGGEVPRTIEEMTRLPGVGRKTANVVLGAAMGVASGIVVDTHVHRVARRLGLTRQKDPDKIEQDLMQLVPRSEWIHFGMSLVLHGRYVCTARKPKCDQCILSDVCPKVGVK